MPDQPAVDRPELFVAAKSGECPTCLYDFSDFSEGEEVGYVDGEINCDGCFDRAEAAARPTP